MIKVASNQKGSVMVLFAVLLIGLLGMAGLVVDVGYAYSEKTKIQNAVDAAAIAAAYELPIKADARTEADNYLSQNLKEFESAKATYNFLNDNKRIEVTYKTNINTFFMRALGFDTVPVGAFAAAERKSMTGQYVLFSGSSTKEKFNVVLGRVEAHGSIHSNSDINMYLGSRLIIEDGYIAEAVKGIDTSWLSRITGTVDEAALPIAMPRLEPSFENELINKATPITDRHWFTREYLLPKNLHIDGEMFYYAPGDLTNRDFGSWTGKGKVMLIADGDITIDLNVMNSIDFNDSENMICFYSRKKGSKIELSGNLAVFRGILYAPDGKVKFEISGDSLYGGVISDSIYIGGALLHVRPSDCPRWFPVGVKVTLAE